MKKNQRTNRITALFIALSLWILLLTTAAFPIEDNPTTVKRDTDGCTVLLILQIGIVDTDDAVVAKVRAALAVLQNIDCVIPCVRPPNCEVNIIVDVKKWSDIPDADKVKYHKVKMEDGNNSWAWAGIPNQKDNYKDTHGNIVPRHDPDGNWGRGENPWVYVHEAWHLFGLLDKYCDFKCVRRWWWPWSWKKTQVRWCIPSDPACDCDPCNPKPRCTWACAGHAGDGMAEDEGVFDSSHILAIVDLAALADPALKTCPEVPCCPPPPGCQPQPTHPQDHGKPDCFDKQIYPPDLSFEGPWDLVREALYITNDIPDPDIDSIAGIVIPLCFTSSNPAAHCSISSYWNNLSLTGPAFARSIFRNLGTDSTWMKKYYEDPNGPYDWANKILALDGTSHFWLSLVPTTQPLYGDEIHDYTIAVAFKITDSTTICNDTCFWPPAYHLAFARKDAVTYVPQMSWKNSEGEGEYCANIVIIPPIVCGDCNQSGIVELGDVVKLITYLYKGGSAPDPLCIADVNCDSIVALGDVVHLITYLYKGGTPPCQQCCSAKAKMEEFPGQEMERDLLQIRPEPQKAPQTPEDLNRIR
jgi:hypothetical protein